MRNNFAPVVGARFASTAGDGKIHQVIGAVVDGTRKTPQGRNYNIHYMSLAMKGDPRTDIRPVNSQIRLRHSAANSQCLGDGQWWPEASP